MRGFAIGEAVEGVLSRKKNGQEQLGASLAAWTLRLTATRPLGLGLWVGKGIGVQ